MDKTERALPKVGRGRPRGSARQRTWHARLRRKLRTALGIEWCGGSRVGLHDPHRVDDAVARCDLQLARKAGAVQTLQHERHVEYRVAGHRFARELPTAETRVGP